MHSISEENYIKTIYHLQESDTLVSTNEIAAQMQTKASSVTDMLKKLAEKNIADYIPYKGAKLTQKGKDYATQIIRKHRLWEVFLVEKLDFSWDEVHEVAEQLEHIQSKKLIDQLDKLLDYPTHDPHGDPIPDNNGQITHIEKIILSKAAINTTGKLVMVTDSSTAFLNYLDKHTMRIGVSINVKDREEFDGSIVIETNDKKFQISQETAEKLFITITN